MKLITLRDYLRGLHKEWSKTSKWRGKMYDGLRALDPETCTPEDISAITRCGEYRPNCSHCMEPSDTLVEVEKGEEYERDEVALCKKCLIEAMSLFPS